MFHAVVLKYSKLHGGFRKLYWGMCRVYPVVLDHDGGAIENCSQVCFNCSLLDQ